MQSERITDIVGRAYAEHRRTTHRVENISQLGEGVVRVVASFNRAPQNADVAALVAAEFAGAVEVIPHSWLARTKLDPHERDTAVGYVRARAHRRDLSDTAGLKEIAHNVYMDPEDNLIWTVEGDQIVRAAKENLAEIARAVDLPRLKPGHGHPEALTRVADYTGPRDTQVMAYVDTETSTVHVGVRVADSHVYSETAGLQEIAQDQVVAVRHLQGADYTASTGEPALAAVADADAMVDYYSKLYSYDPDFWNSIKGDILDKALM